MRHMTRCSIVLFTAFFLIGLARPASADWLLTPFASRLREVKTTGSESLQVPAERFRVSDGVGISLASALPAQANLGFEFDFAWYPQALQQSNQYDDVFASQLMTIGTNVFFSPSVPVVRPYVSIGPTFGYRLDLPRAVVPTPSGWAFGANAGAGIFGFITQRIGGRVDVRYFRNLGEFYDLREAVEVRRTGWKDLRFFRVSAGVTFVL